MVEVNSETDFVARNDEFQEMVRAIAAAALKAKGDLDSARQGAISAAARSRSPIT